MEKEEQIMGSLKIIIVGDTHGLPDWEKIKNQHCHRFVFLGDYFDSHQKEITAKMQIANFEKIVAFKKEFPKKVILLIGNHDYHYLQGIEEHYSGYQPGAAPLIQQVLEENISLMQMVFQRRRFLVSHAGISKEWCKNNGIDITQDNIDDQVNELWDNKRSAFQFHQKGVTLTRMPSSIGDDIWQSPIWIRPNSLQKVLIPSYQQIVGHTYQENLSIVNGVFLIDCMDTSKEYLFIDGEKVQVRSLQTLK